MGQTEFVGCISINDSQGKPIQVAEVKTITKDSYKNLVKQATENQRAKAESENKKAKEREEKEKALYSRLDNISILLAYQMFNELVERGKAKTTNEFETMFTLWLSGKSELDKNLCPKEYLDILERLGVNYGRN